MNTVALKLSILAFMSELYSGVEEAPAPEEITKTGDFILKWLISELPEEKEKNAEVVPLRPVN